MRWTQATLPESVLHEAHARFLEFAGASSFPRLWHAVADNAWSDCDPPAGPIIAGDTVMLRTRASVAARLRRAAGRLPLSREPACAALVLDEPIDSLWEFASTLDERQRAGLDVLLRRATDHLEALATWPLRALFTPQEEEQLLAGSPRTAPPPDTAPHVTPGTEQAYDGYVCVIAKFTRLCNLRCVYCHDWRAGPNQTMTFEVKTQLFRRLLEDRDHRAVDIVWHGGEPTLLSPRQFQRILTLERWYQQPGQELCNVVQTNGTTLNADWVALLSRYRFRVGVSLDGPPQVHDKTRPSVGGKPTSARVELGLRTLKAGGISPSILMVISDAVVEHGAEAVLEYFRRVGVSDVGFLPSSPGSGPGASASDYLDRGKYFDFLLEIDRIRRSDPTLWVNVRELDAALAAVREEPAQFCELVGGCIGAYYSIEVNGDIAHCDKFIGDNSYTLGNVAVDDFSEIRRSPRVVELRAENRTALERQRGCRYFGYCHGWCPHERYLALRYDDGHSADCCGLARLFASIEPVAAASELISAPTSHDAGPTY